MGGNAETSDKYNDGMPRFIPSNSEVVTFLTDLGLNPAEITEARLHGTTRQVSLTIHKSTLASPFASVTAAYVLADSDGNPLGPGHPVLMEFLKNVGLDPEGLTEFELVFTTQDAAKAHVTLLLDKPEAFDNTKYGFKLISRDG